MRRGCVSQQENRDHEPVKRRQWREFQRRPDVPGDLLRALFRNVTDPSLCPPTPPALRTTLAGFTDDRFVARLKIAFDDFRVDAIVETWLDQDRHWLSVAQDPKLQGAVRQRFWTAAA